MGMTLFCVWIAGMLSGVYLGAVDTKGKLHMASIVFGPLIIAIALSLLLNLMVALTPYIQMDVIAKDMVEFFSQ